MSLNPIEIIFFVDQICSFCFKSEIEERLVGEKVFESKIGYVV